MPTSFFALVIGYFRDRHLCPAGLNPDPPIYVSHVTEMTDVHHYTSFLLVAGGGRGSLMNFFPGLTWNFNPSDPPPEQLGLQV
jgi:hypothetical protein